MFPSRRCFNLAQVIAPVVALLWRPACSFQSSGRSSATLKAKLPHLNSFPSTRVIDATTTLPLIEHPRSYEKERKMQGNKPPAEEKHPLLPIKSPQRRSPARDRKTRTNTGPNRGERKRSQCNKSPPARMDAGTLSPFQRGEELQRRLARSGNERAPRLVGRIAPRAAAPPVSHPSPLCIWWEKGSYLWVSRMVIGVAANDGGGGEGDNGTAGGRVTWLLWEREEGRERGVGDSGRLQAPRPRVFWRRWSRNMFPSRRSVCSIYCSVGGRRVFDYFGEINLKLGLFACRDTRSRTDCADAR